MISTICLQTLLASLQAAHTPDPSMIPVVSNITGIERVYTCPRCRRAKPPGARKRPTPANEGSN